MENDNILTPIKAKPRIVAKVSKIENIVKISTEANLASAKLLKTFEKGTYQKKTQLSVLKRYKRRLDGIDKVNDNNSTKKRKEKVKQPDIKKYLGNFFSAGSDPLKSIAALAAFKAASKIGTGKPFEALGPALVASGILLGPGLLRLGTKAMFGGGLFNSSSRPRITTSGGKDISKSRNPFKNTSVTTGNSSRNPGRGPRITGSPTEKFLFRSGKAFSKFGAAAIPGLGAVVGGADSIYRAKSGDITGSAIAGTAATLDATAAGLAATGIGLPIAGILSIGSFVLDIVNLTRDIFGVSEAESKRNSITDKLKSQKDKQKKNVKSKSDDKGQLTFSKTLIRYESAVDKFEKFSKSFSPSTRARGYVDGREPPPPPPPPGNNEIEGTQVFQDASEFRSQFPLARGTPNTSIDPYELQMRENDALYRAGIGNDPKTDRVHVEGSAHYDNRAIDIPVNNKQLGDRVAKFWRDRGYYVLWQVAGHYNHVHVQWNSRSSQTMDTSGNGNKKGYIIIPGHAAGDGAPGEKELVKKLARDAYNKIKMKNPNAPVQYMDLDSMFTDNKAGFDKQKKWYEKMEKDGYEILEIHMDEPNGRRGVIRSHGKQSGAATEFASKFGAFPMRHRSPTNDPNHPDKTMRPLAGPHRGVDLFELGTMTPGKTYSFSDISKLTSDFASMDFSLSSTRRRSPAISPVQTSRSISSYPSYSSRSTMQSQVINVPVPVPQSNITSNLVQSNVGGSFVDESEWVLNSFYKRVLFSTLQ